MSNEIEALRQLKQAAQGFQSAILEATGHPYPWPALDLAYEAADAVIVSAAPDRAASVEDERAALRASLEIFTAHYEPWMDERIQGGECTVHSRHTFAQLKMARNLLDRAALTKQPAKEQPK